jgi:uncharacterized protein (DUF433 family)
MEQQSKNNSAGLLARITIDPEICHGKPCIRGLRYPVETILELLSAGMTFEEILADYEDLEREDILAALAYAARLSNDELNWRAFIAETYGCLADVPITCGDQGQYEIREPIQ